jgi:hypothetical protein
MHAARCKTEDVHTARSVSGRQHPDTSSPRTLAWVLAVLLILACVIIAIQSAALSAGPGPPPRKGPDVMRRAAPAGPRRQQDAPQHSRSARLSPGTTSAGASADYHRASAAAGLAGHRSRGG